LYLLTDNLILTFAMVSITARSFGRLYISYLHDIFYLSLHIWLCIFFLYIWQNLLFWLQYYQWFHVHMRYKVETYAAICVLWGREATGSIRCHK
jgi:hypothetical protein